MSHDGPKNPSSWVDATFALFVLADISNDAINRVIKEAYEGSTVNCYFFWLADDKYSNAPRRIKSDDGEHTHVESGTEPPIPKDWKSPLSGKSAEDAAEILKQAPENLCVDFHHFAVLGSDFEKRGIVTIYRIGDSDLNGDELNSLPCSVEGSTRFLSSIEKHMWEEYKQTQKDKDDPVS